MSVPFWRILGSFRTSKFQAARTFTFFDLCATLNLHVTHFDFCTSRNSKILTEICNCWQNGPVTEVSLGLDGTASRIGAKALARTKQVADETEPGQAEKTASQRYSADRRTHEIKSETGERLDGLSSLAASCLARSAMPCLLRCAPCSQNTCSYTI